MFRENHRHANHVLRNEGVGELPMFLLDSAVLTDWYLQFTCPSFEYPRSDLPPHVSFVGPILAPAPASFEPAPWWDELDGDRPVVHVTQGTVDNTDLGRLIAPTLQALSDAEVLVVTTTCGRPLTDIPAVIPANARIADFIPHAALLPRVDVVITNGGYGGVHQALANGVPLIVAGDTEDKPEVAARVAWSGTGIDLHSGQPSPQAIRRAVDTILTTPSYRDNARRMAQEIAGMSALDAVTQALAAATSTPDKGARQSAGH
jgi:UDP:flavonoid glycosyltransferase YjiC (YdhE family)